MAAKLFLRNFDDTESRAEATARATADSWTSRRATCSRTLLQPEMPLTILYSPSAEEISFTRFTQRRASPGSRRQRTKSGFERSATMSFLWKLPAFRRRISPARRPYTLSARVPEFRRSTATPFFSNMPAMEAPRFCADLTRTLKSEAFRPSSTMSFFMALETCSTSS